MTDLPRPATAIEMYLAAAVDELRAIRAALSQRAELQPGEVDLREPATPDTDKRPKKRS